MEAFTFNTAELILLSAAGILFIIQLIYYFGLYNRIHVRNKTVRKEETHFSRELPPLSVILCARNEADNLRKILPASLITMTSACYSGTRLPAVRSHCYQ